MNSDDSFKTVLKSLADNESLIDINVLGRDENIRGTIIHIGGDYIKIKPDGPTGGRVYFIRFGAISCVDAVEPMQSKPELKSNMPLPDKQEEDRYQIRRRPL